MIVLSTGRCGGINRTVDSYLRQAGGRILDQDEEPAVVSAPAVAVRRSPNGLVTGLSRQQRWVDAPAAKAQHTWLPAPACNGGLHGRADRARAPGRPQPGVHEGRDCPTQGDVEAALVDYLYVDDATAAVLAQRIDLGHQELNAMTLEALRFCTSWSLLPEGYANLVRSAMESAHQQRPVAAAAAAAEPVQRRRRTT